MSRIQSDKFTWQGSDLVVSQCLLCARVGRSGGCAAFPAGIPGAILRNEVDHRRPYLDPETGDPADTGITGERPITFEPAADADAEALASLYHRLDGLHH